VCDRVGIFAAGRLIGHGTVDELATAFGDDTAHVEVGLELTAPGEADRAEALLAGIDGVVSVTRPQGPTDDWRLDVRPASEGARVRQAALAVCASNTLTLTSLRATVPSLDEIYRRAVVRSRVATAGVAV
jgi:hypothetical protein